MKNVLNLVKAYRWLGNYIIGLVQLLICIDMGKHTLAMPIGDNDSAMVLYRVQVVVLDVQSGVTLSVELARGAGQLVPEVFCE